MSGYKGLFETLGLQDWCNQGSTSGPATMEQLLARLKGADAVEKPWWDVPFPSLDNLNAACPAIAPHARYDQWLGKWFFRY